MPIIDNEAVGSRIHNIRLSMVSKTSKRKMSLEEFGKLLEPPASKSVIRAWEKGFHLPQRDKLEQLANIGNVSVDFLLYGKVLAGYGEKIREIREKITEDNLELFGKLFTPPVSSSVVESWELENSLPNWEQIEKLTTLSGKSYKQIIFGMDPMYSDRRNMNTSITFEKTEKLLESSLETIEDFFQADFLFFYLDVFRRTQVKDEKHFKPIYIICDHLTWLTGDLPKPSYKYNDSSKSIKQYNNIEEEIESSIQEINKQLEIMKQNLLDKYKEN
ncbi:helix-turn-helix domain-containing protein [Vagococcus fluvialis]|uniref:helix-turn-helix domain-containing protein n=1 Tax=Vagococcus fluvialis TaxID=2738 RepID=UPI0037B9C7F3